MKRFLLDVNALLALLDPMHVHHEAAHRQPFDIETFETTKFPTF